VTSSSYRQTTGRCQPDSDRSNPPLHGPAIPPQEWRIAGLMERGRLSAEGSVRHCALRCRLPQRSVPARTAPTDTAVRICVRASQLPSAWAMVITPSRGAAPISPSQPPAPIRHPRRLGTNTAQLSTSRSKIVYASNQPTAKPSLEPSMSRAHPQPGPVRPCAVGIASTTKTRTRRARRHALGLGYVRNEERPSRESRDRVTEDHM